MRRRTLICLLCLLTAAGVFYPGYRSHISEVYARSSSDLPLVPDAATTYLATSGARRINAPYFENNILLEQGAIAWFGQVDSAHNYADVRVGYNDALLRVNVQIFDRYLWYDETPTAIDLTDWDAVTLYLNLDGNTGDTLTSGSLRFVAQLNHWQERQNYQAVYTGNGTTWTSSSIPFATASGWRGNSLNDGSEARGWSATFGIPFDSLGLSAPPDADTRWGMAIVVHDRDASSGTTIPLQSWPAAVNTQRPATWGQLAFGWPVYRPATTNVSGRATIRHGLNGTLVPDGHVGGTTLCGADYGPDFFDGWGDANYAGDHQINIQNQSDVADWPCFSKYYITFPLASLPQNKRIISATLTLYQFGNSGQGWDPGPQPSLIQVLAVADEWDEATLTWNNAPLATQNIGASWVYPVDAMPDWPGIPVRWDVSQSVADAYRQGAPVHLALYSADAAIHSGKYFSTSDVEEWNADGRPTLEITWGDAPSEPPPSTGNVSCDGGVDLLDALYILQYEVALKGAAQQCPLPPNTIYLPSCDVNEDDACNVIDALFVLQCTANIESRWCSAISPTSSTAASQVTLPPDISTTASLVVPAVEGGSNQEVTVTISADTLTSTIGVAAVEVRYDPTLLEPKECEADPDQHFDGSACNQSYESDGIAPDSLRFNLMAAFGITGIVRLADITFLVKGEAGDRSEVQVLPQGWTANGAVMIIPDQSAPVRIVDVVEQEPSSALFLPMTSR